MVVLNLATKLCSVLVQEFTIKILGVLLFLSLFKVQKSSVKYVENLDI